jgi:hypothetical protein
VAFSCWSAEGGGDRGGDVPVVDVGGVAEEEDIWSFLGASARMSRLVYKCGSTHYGMVFSESLGIRLRS